MLFVKNKKEYLYVLLLYLCDLHNERELKRRVAMWNSIYLNIIVRLVIVLYKPSNPAYITLNYRILKVILVCDDTRQTRTWLVTWWMLMPWTQDVPGHPRM